MNDFLSTILQVLGVQPTQLISPIPQSQFEDNNNMAYQLYRQREALGNMYAGTPHGAYPDFQYNQSIANAPMATPTPTSAPVMTGNPYISQRRAPIMIEGVSPQVSQSFIGLMNQILPVTRQYGIPDAVVAGQMAHESAYGQKPAGKNNYFGLKAHSYPGFAHFDTPQQGATYYAQTVQSLVPNLKQLKNDPMGVLNALQSGSQHYEGDNPNPQQYVYDVTQNPAWRAYGGGAPLAVNPRGWK